MEPTFAMHKSTADLIVAEERRLGKVAWTPKGVVIHYTALPSPSSNVVEHIKAIDEFHRLKRGYKMIGYHILIHKSGMVFGGRPLHLQGAHAKGHNNTIGVALMANEAELRYENAPMEHALRETLKALCRHFNIPYTSVVLHRQLNYTQCPPLSQRLIAILHKDGFVSISLDKKRG